MKSVVICNLLHWCLRFLKSLTSTFICFYFLFQVKCKSDLDKSAKIAKLRLQYEHELHSFCKQDQKDLVCYLQRQILLRDQRIAEQSYDIEQLKGSSLSNSIHENNVNVNKKCVQIQILKSSDPDLVISTVSFFALIWSFVDIVPDNSLDVMSFSVSMCRFFFYHRY